MARFDPQEPRPADNSQITSHPIAPQGESPYEAMRPGLAWARAGMDVANLGLGLIKLQQQNQFTEGQLAVSQHLDAAMQKIQQTPGGYATAAADYQTALKQVQQGVIGQSNYDDPVKQRLLRYSQFLSAGQQVRLNQWAWQQNKAAAETRDDLARQDLINHIAQEPVGSPSRAILIKGLQSLGYTRVGTLYTEPQADAINQKALNAADASTFEYTLAHSPQAALNFVKDDKISPYLTTEQRGRMQLEAQSKLKEMDDANTAAIEHSANELLTNIATNGSASPAELQQTQQALSGLKNGAQRVTQFKAAVALNQKLYGDKQAMQYMPAPQQLAYMQKLKAWANAPGDDIMERQAAYNQLVDAYNQNATLLHTDPRSYVENLMGQTSDDDHTPAGEARTFARVDSLYQKLGITNGPLLTNAAAGAAAQQYINLSASDPGRALQWLNNLKKQYPPQYLPRVEQQLFALLPPSAWVLAGDTENPTTAASIMATDHMSVSDMRNAIGKQRVGAADQAIDTSWKPMEPALGPAGDKLKPIYQKIAYNLIAHAGMDPEAATAKATQILFGKYNFTHTAAGEWMFPVNLQQAYGLTQDKVMAYAQHVIQTADYAGGTDATNYARLNQPNVWQYYPQSNTYALVDSSHNLVSGADGKPISFSLMDAAFNLKPGAAVPQTGPVPKAKVPVTRLKAEPRDMRAP